MAGEPPVRQTPVTLLALSLPPFATRPALILATASHWLFHAEPPVAGPPSRWLWPQRRTERTVRGIPLPGYVFVLMLNVLKRGCASEALSLITLRCGFRVRKVAWSVLQTRPHMGRREVKIKRWCLAAAPIRKKVQWGRLRLEFAQRNENGQISGFEIKYGKLQAENYLLVY